LDSKRLEVKFWGTRGHVSSPRIETAEHGGNTSCIQILYKDHLIIVDTGFGISLLGEELMPEILKEHSKLNVHIFYTHFHWDHIQGLPFFHPVYFPNCTLNLYSPLKKEDYYPHLDILFDGSYSPFAGIENMPSNIVFSQLSKEKKIDDLSISFSHLNHKPNPEDSGSYAYKFSLNKKSIVIATDHEAIPSEKNDALVDFAKNASILIHDGQFSEKEYLDHSGWGHSTFDMALDNALKASCEKLLITHHAPHRNDSEIKKIEKSFQENEKFKQLDFEFAKEGRLYKAR
jgi:phosphoribosyl 1,2-cyclic phosphodiesterase